MSRTVYLNGEYLPLEQAAVSVEDRGFLLGDGVYEVVRYYNGAPLAMQMHIDRLHESLRQIRLPLGALHGSREPDFEMLSHELIRRNQCPDGYVYWQVTRGAAPRTHPFPPTSTPPTVYASADAAPPLLPETSISELRAITRPDVRWANCEIKTTSLLANVLDAQAAADAGCDEAILIRDGVVTEGSRRSILLVIDGQIVTYPLDGRILDSITRRIVLDLARQGGYTVREEPPPADALSRADEIIALGSTTDVAAVTHVDAQPINHGAPGPAATDLFERYKQHIFTECGQPSTA